MTATFRASRDGRFECSTLGKTIISSAASATQLHHAVMGNCILHLHTSYDHVDWRSTGTAEHGTLALKMTTACYTRRRERQRRQPSLDEIAVPPSFSVGTKTSSMIIVASGFRRFTWSDYIKMYGLKQPLLAIAACLQPPRQQRQR